MRCKAVLALSGNICDVTIQSILINMKKKIKKLKINRKKYRGKKKMYFY